ncbi:MAG: hypothetical protein HQK83_04540 [Fibrobacteria bacterium]|nr:hypothetical protein [Fibrobacteria bacterium]
MEDYMFFGSFGDSIEIISAKDYEDKFSTINCTVSYDSHNKDEKERWVLRKFLNCCVFGNRLSYPIKFATSEQPDFIVNQPEHCYGIEVTEAVVPKYHQAYAHARNRGKGEYPIDSYFREEVKIGKKRLHETFQDPNKPLRGAPWIDNKGLEMSLKLIIDSVKKKTEHLNSYDYQGITDIDLLIYLNSPSSIHTQIEELTRAFPDYLLRNFQKDCFKKNFRNIHILKGTSIIFNASS